MNFDAMVDAVLDARFGEGRRTTAKRKVNTAISAIWGEHPWAFKRRPPVTITATASNDDGLYDVTATEVIEDILGCYDIEEAVNMVEDAIEEDFLQKVSADYDARDIRAKVAEVFARRDENGPQE